VTYGLHPSLWYLSLKKATQLLLYLPSINVTGVYNTIPQDIRTHPFYSYILKHQIARSGGYQMHLLFFLISMLHVYIILLLRSSYFHSPPHHHHSSRSQYFCHVLSLVWPNSWPLSNRNVLSQTNSRKGIQTENINKPDLSDFWPKQFPCIENNSKWYSIYISKTRFHLTQLLPYMKLYLQS
jgi:hypothetical protein